MRSRSSSSSFASSWLDLSMAQCHCTAGSSWSTGMKHGAPHARAVHMAKGLVRYCKRGRGMSEQVVELLTGSFHTFHNTCI